MIPNDSTAGIDLWERLEPEALRRMVEVFAAIGQGVHIELIPDREEEGE